MYKSLLSLSLLTLSSASAFAADYSDGDIHKNDFKWAQMNLMYAVDELPGGSSHDYVEFEFGGRSGIFDVYGYLDVFNVTTDPDSDKADAKSKMFLKFQPRMSLDAVTGLDLSFGPVQEVYIASEITSDGASSAADSYAVNQQKIGLGSDVMVPWLGKVGLNLFATYDSSKKDWNGYQISTNWFKPVYFFANETFIAYQGYIDYQFGLEGKYSTASSGGAMFNGIYWHSPRYSVGYGLKLYSDVYGIKDSDSFESSGVSHYFAATYKF